MGANRELKKLVENSWSGKITEEQLLSGAKELREIHWQIQKDCGIEHIPSNDASMYDHVLDHLFVFGAIPERYQNIPSRVDKYFAMGRGLQRHAEGIDVPAMEMKKWFDTNYHYIVGEFSPNQTFHLQDTKPIDQYLEAKALGINTRPVLLGPVSFLALGKPGHGVPQEFDTTSLLDNLLPVYIELITKLQAAGAEWIQFDEPILSLDRPAHYKEVYEKAYKTLTAAAPKIKFFVASYFGRYSTNLDFVVDLPIHALHVDLIRAPGDLDIVLQRIKSKSLLISVGVINGRNVWKANLAEVIATVKKAIDVVGTDRVIVSPSCPLLHTPHTLDTEVKMDAEIKSWMSFSVQKLIELDTIVQAIVSPGSVDEKLADNARCVETRKTSSLNHDQSVQAEMKAVTPEMRKRISPFAIRAEKQQEKLKLPLYPCTTVGSFPQTKEVRVARQKFKKREITEQEYNEFIKTEIEKTVRFQEKVGLDVLVHGEFERNDMVEYFGEVMKGYVFSQYGWVQSYGSRCVKPPIIYGDVSRPAPMTIETAVFAQSLTKLPMKGMLTGPVTMLFWSFVRDDQPISVTTNQIALALRKEVGDLAKAGIPCIQIDEPALREGLPLRKEDQDAYLDWAVKAFLLATTNVPDQVQIHTHMCYSDFNDIFEAIQGLDTDCITIENSKSDLKLLRAFEKFGYTSGIGPGLYDIHSPRVPPAQEMKERLTSINKYISSKLLWVNPDCGLKTRGWVETEAALKNMCDVAKQARAAAIA
jgi:5-methyltetrahydropteroyltriglutamate--homocysteine methyltransferase